MPIFCPPKSWYSLLPYEPMSSPRPRTTNQNFFLLVLLAAVVAFFLGWLFVAYPTAVITASSPLLDRLWSLFVACIPNILTGLIAFIIIYSVFQVRGINTNISSEIDADALANEIVPRLNTRLRTEPLDSAQIQKLAQDLSLLVQRRQVAFSNNDIQKLAQEMVPDLVGQIRHLSVNESHIRTLVTELQGLIHSQYNLEQQAQRVGQLQQHYREQTKQSYLMASILPH